MGWLLLTHDRRRRNQRRTFSVGDVCVYVCVLQVGTAQRSAKRALIKSIDSTRRKEEKKTEKKNKHISVALRDVLYAELVCFVSRGSSLACAE